MRWRCRGFARRLLAVGDPGLRLPAGAFIVELGAALRLQAGLAPLLLQVSRGGSVDVSPGGLVRQGGAVVGGIREHHGALGAPPADQPLAGLRVIVVKVSRGRGRCSPGCRVLLRACRRCAREGTRHNAVGKERAPGVELQDPRRNAAGLPSAQIVDREGSARNGGDGGGREEGS
jgi:hypothetical protein